MTRMVELLATEAQYTAWQGYAQGAGQTIEEFIKSAVADKIADRELKAEGSTTTTYYFNLHIPRLDAVLDCDGDLVDYEAPDGIFFKSTDLLHGPYKLNPDEERHIIGLLWDSFESSKWDIFPDQYDPSMEYNNEQFAVDLVANDIGFTTKFKTPSGVRFDEHLIHLCGQTFEK